MFSHRRIAPAAFTLVGLFALCALCAVAPVSAATAAKPNVLTIMVDDLDEDMFDLLLENGWLPNIEHYLLEQGTRFDNSFVSDPVCCPSRTTYITGQYVKNHGVLGVTKGVAYWYWDEEADNPENRAMAVQMQRAGYFTGHVGKYLNGYGMYSPAEYTPKGYDQWYGLLDPTTYDMYDYRMNVTRDGNTEIVQYQGYDAAHYQTDVLRDRALDFLAAADQQLRPFFLTVTPVAPHIETISFSSDEALGYKALFREYIRPAPRHECLVSDYVDHEVDASNEVCLRELPDSLAFLEAKPAFNVLGYDKHPRLTELPQTLTEADGDFIALERQHQMRMASMLAVDDLVGSLLSQLEADGRLDNTVVLFTSDNGYFQGEHALDSKLLAYEESIRVPLLVRGPGIAGGARLPDVVINNDLAPTIADYGDAHPIRPGDAYDGRSLRARLEGGRRLARRQFMTEHFIEATAQELAAEYPQFEELTDEAIEYIENLTGIELGSLTDLAYPAFKALRRTDASGSWLYLQWYANETNDGPWVVDFEELYQLDSDVDQLVNLVPNAENDESLQAQLVSMRQDLDAMKECAGENCQRIEDRVSPVALRR